MNGTLTLMDWLVMGGTIFLIVAYGIWKSRGAKNIEGYLLSNRDMKWWTIGLSVMATQASAITFLSTTGQAFDDGMRFVQFYFGVPIAMVLISMIAIPIYHRLKVYTAYEYLEKRFDLKTRALGAFLFLIGRSLAAGFTIYAPALILAVILGWPLEMTVLGTGAVVILYTLSGGTKAVAVTQKYQMAVILLGMVAAGVYMVLKLPDGVSFTDALALAGKSGKLNALTFDFSFDDKYNIWTGLIGGTFLALAYFGTDQSQVQRYLGGKSVTQSRMGLIFNGMAKVPLQFLILFIGAMMFVFFMFHSSPLLFNKAEVAKLQQSQYADSYNQLEADHDAVFSEMEKKHEELKFAKSSEDESNIPGYRQDELVALSTYQNQLKREGRSLAAKLNGAEEGTNDLDYIFLSWVIGKNGENTNLPIGMVGLLIAVILSASMSSTAAELNALSATTVTDIYKRMINSTGSEGTYLNMSRLMTLFWGLVAMGFALFASKLGNLIEAVNVLGSLFYGVMLGIFIVAFFMKWVRGTAIFLAALIGEGLVIACFLFGETIFGQEIAWLWFNVIGASAVIILALLFQPIFGGKAPEVAEDDVEETYDTADDYYDTEETEDAFETEDEEYEADVNDFEEETPVAPPPPVYTPPTRKEVIDALPFDQLGAEEKDAIVTSMEHMKRLTPAMARALRKISPHRNAEIWGELDGKTADIIDFEMNPDDYRVTFYPTAADGTRINEQQLLPEEGPLLPLGSNQLSPSSYDQDDASRQRYADYKLHLDKVMVSWFAHAWMKAGGRAAHFPAYISYPDTTKSYDLKRNVWVNDDYAKWG